MLHQDLLGRVVQSVEHRPDNPTSDTTVYTYTPSGRLASEARTGQVEYNRSYGYNPDGSRAEVSRSDALNGTHWDIYLYEEASGRLQSVLDLWTGEVDQFVWNPEGTLARWWNTEPNSYARVFGYDEEGRLVQIERDYGNGNLQTAYEYGYNSDGVKVLERRYRTAQHWIEYRFIGCGAGCAGNSLSLYAREYISGQNTAWRRAEEYVNAPTALLYGVPTDAATPVVFVLHPMVNGSVVHFPDGQMVAPYYTDSGGMQVGGYALPACAKKRDWEAGCVPSSSVCSDSSVSLDLPYLDANGTGGLPQFGLTTNHYVMVAIALPILIAALRGCVAGVGVDTLISIAKWLGCAITSFIRGLPIVPTCGAFPVPGLCDIITSCVTGALTGGMLVKWFPRLKESIRDFIAALIGAIGGGVCTGVSAPAPAPCPSPAPSPKPKPPSPPIGGGGGYRPLPAA